MNGEFNGICNYYYRLTKLLEAREEHFQNLLANAQPYRGETKLSELDALIAYNREVHQAKAESEKTAADMREAEGRIMGMMQYFGIPPLTKLKGEITEELAFEIWADDNDTIFISKTKDLAPLPDEENIIRIKFASSLSGMYVVNKTGRTDRTR
jgi:hypothetical protein